MEGCNSIWSTVDHEMKLCLISWGVLREKPASAIKMVTHKALTQGCWLATIHLSLPTVPLSQFYTFSFRVSSNILGLRQPGSKSCQWHGTSVTSNTHENEKKNTAFPKVAVRDAQEASWRSNITWTVEVARSSPPASLVARKIHSHCGNFWLGKTSFIKHLTDGSPIMCQLHHHFTRLSLTRLTLW